MLCNQVTATKQFTLGRSQRAALTWWQTIVNHGQCTSSNGMSLQLQTNNTAKPCAAGKILLPLHHTLARIGYQRWNVPLIAIHVCRHGEKNTNAGITQPQRSNEEISIYW